MSFNLILNIIYKNDKEVGIVSIQTLYCFMEKTGNEGKIALPIICNGDISSVLSVLVNICDQLEYSLIYFYEYGDVNEKGLEQINSIKTNAGSWFSLYNNKINLRKEDISVPLL